MRHNVSNALAAVAVGLLFGVAPDGIRAAATSFHGVEHRLETVAIVDGVRFVNDSQGTQPDAVIAALRAFDAPVVLIAGGRDKGIDLSALAPVVAERAVAAVLIGESGPRLAADFRAAGLAGTVMAPTLDAAVRTAEGLARDAWPGAGGRIERRPCCSARRPPASTCSPTTRRAASPSRRPSRPWLPTVLAGGTDESRAAHPPPHTALARLRPSRRRDRGQPPASPPGPGPGRWSGANVTARTT